MQGAPIDRKLETRTLWQRVYDQLRSAILEPPAPGLRVEMHQQLAGQMGRYQMPSLAIRGSLHRSIAEHRAIIRAISARNAERAMHLISEHIRVPQRSLEAEPRTDPIVVHGPEPFEQTAMGLRGGRPPATGRSARSQAPGLSRASPSARRSAAPEPPLG